ncbi:hypothetical protein AMELA_G00044030, partial [Ameiurus melas]
MLIMHVFGLGEETGELGGNPRSTTVNERREVRHGLPLNIGRLSVPRPGTWIQL